MSVRSRDALPRFSLGILLGILLSRRRRNASAAPCAEGHIRGGGGRVDIAGYKRGAPRAFFPPQVYWEALRIVGRLGELIWELIQVN